MRLSKARRFIVAWGMVAGLCLLSCAKMGAPPGGPEDQTGPFLVRTYPKPDTINVPRQMVARLEFSEPVNRSSVEAALFLSPDPVQRLRYRWRGQVLELVYLDELEPDRTYVIGVGNQAKDLRGNPSGTTEIIAFSTGSRIDRGRIDGWITDVETPQSVSIWAYRLDGDSIADPAATVADYQIQPAASGRVAFMYLQAGRYRTFAVQDKDRNRLWNPSTEMIALPPWDVVVTDTSVEWVSFKLSHQDTTPPQLRSARSVNAFEYLLRTTTPVETLNAVAVSERGDSVVTLDRYRDLKEPDTWRVFPLDSLTPGPWTVGARGLSLFGQSWADTESLNVRAAGDTSRPVVVRSDPPLRDRARRIVPEFRLEFSEPLVLDATGLARAYFRSADRDSLGATIRQLRSRIIAATPDSSFQPGMYTLWLNGEAIRDRAGNAAGDSAVDLRFGFYAPDSLGSLMMHFDAPPDQYIFQMYSTGRTRALVETLVLPAPVNANIGDLPPGRYTMEIVRDVDADSAYSPGRVHPWRYAEPYFVPVDTIVIRARWEQEISFTWPQ